MLLRGHTERDKEIMMQIFNNPFISHKDIQDKIGCSRMAISRAVRQYLPYTKRVTRLQLFYTLGYIKPFKTHYPNIHILPIVMNALEHSPHVDYAVISKRIGYHVQYIRDVMVYMYKAYQVQTESTLFMRLKLYETIEWFDVNRLRDDLESIK